VCADANPGRVLLELGKGSAVLEPDGNLRPCFFHSGYGSAAGGLEEALNSPHAVAFRQSLGVDRNQICQRCVCSLNLPLTQRV
jgi:radical SAM protein with 4Fe4S-binding SPASM domain